MDKGAVKALIDHRINCEAQVMMAMDANGVKRRFNAFDPEGPNLVMDSDANIIMGTGTFGDKVIELRKLCRNEVWAKNVVWSEATWFWILPNMVVPQHIDEDYGVAKRGRDHITITVAGTCTFKFGEELVMDTCVCFNPSTTPHGATAGDQGAMLLQVPVK